MSVYDIVMLIIFFGAVLFGFRKGLAWQVASLLSIVLSYFVAVNFRRPVAALISAQEPWNQFAAMLVLFLGTSLVVWTVFASFSRNIKKLNLGGFDRQAGAVLGGFKGAILCMLVTVFAVSLFQSTSNMVHNSKAGYYVVSGIRQFAQFTPDELVPYLDPHIKKFDESIGATPVKKPLFESSTNGSNFQVNQNGGSPNNGFPNSGFQTNPATTVGGGFSNSTVNSTQRLAPNYRSGQFESTQRQTNSSGFGFNRPQQDQANQNYNPNTPYSQNAPNNQAQPSNEGIFSTGFGRQILGGQNGQTQTQDNSGRFLPQQSPVQPRVTTGQNGWPEINTTINTRDLIQRGAETTAEMLRRAYEANAQSR